MIIKSSDFEQMASILEQSGNYCVLRKVTKPELQKRPSIIENKLGVILDTETTGTDPNSDEIIELGLIKFSYPEDGSSLIPIEEFQGLNQPSSPISEEITRITGINNSMVKGKSINENQLNEFMRDVSLVIAHNAPFDRKFCEKKWNVFSEKAWACSIQDLSWKEEGLQGASLGMILYEFGYFHEGHRAIEDCYAVLQILSENLPVSSKSALHKLLNSARRTVIRIWAEDSPFEAKDILKKRGYSWSNGSNDARRSWWIDVPQEEFESEMKFLKKEIYKNNIDLPIKRLTALDRYSERIE